MDKDLIENVRNAMSHTQFPPVMAGVPKITGPVQQEFEQRCHEKNYLQGYRSLAQQVYEKYEKEIKAIIAQVEGRNNWFFTRL